MVQLTPNGRRQRSHLPKDAVHHWCVAGLGGGIVQYLHSIRHTAQCEFSFSKAEIVMEMNRLEMERYEILYK